MLLFAIDRSEKSLPTEMGPPERLFKRFLRETATFRLISGVASIAAVIARTTFSRFSSGNSMITSPALSEFSSLRTTATAWTPSSDSAPVNCSQEETNGWT